MYCGKCGKSLDDDEIFCKTCGTMRDKKEEKIGTGGKVAGWLIGLVGMLVFGLITGVILALVGA